jgi:hypothetical protein
LSIHSYARSRIQENSQTGNATAWMNGWRAAETFESKARRDCISPETTQVLRL